MGRIALMGVMTVCLAVGTPAAAGDDAAEISKNANAALQSLYGQVEGAKALGAKAHAILVFPKVTKAGLGIGGQADHLLPELAEVEDDDRQDRAQLHHHREGVPEAAGQAHGLFGEEHHARGGNRDELRQALDDPEDDGIDPVRQHGGTPLK